MSGGNESGKTSGRSVAGQRTGPPGAHCAGGTTTGSFPGAYGERIVPGNDGSTTASKGGSSSGRRIGNPLRGQATKPPGVQSAGATGNSASPWT